MIDGLLAAIGLLRLARLREVKLIANLTGVEQKALRGAAERSAGE